MARPSVLSANLFYIYPRYVLDPVLQLHNCPLFDLLNTAFDY